MVKIQILVSTSGEHQNTNNITELSPNIKKKHTDFTKTTDFSLIIRKTPESSLSQNLHNWLVVFGKYWLYSEYEVL